MAFKNDDRKREYRKLYMRRRRAARPIESVASINRRLEELGFPQAPIVKLPGPTVLSLSDPGVELEADRQRYEDWRQSA
jgi:hypothetical protein